MDDQHETRTLANGAIYDMVTKRIVRNPGGGTTAIASREQAVAMTARRVQLKRDRLIAGANRIAAEGGQYDGTDLDFVEAIAEAAMMTALNADSSRQIDAAKMLLRESGLAEQDAQPSATVQADNVQINIIAGDLAASLLAESADTVDGDALDAG